MANVYVEKRTATCCVVWDIDCKSPANLSPLVPCRAECFTCGDNVCTSPGCSRVITYLWYGRKRICRNCAEQNGLEEKFS